MHPAQAEADDTRAIWQRVDDLLLISRVEIEATEQPWTWSHDVNLYKNGHLLRFISQEMHDKGVPGICQDWKVRQQGQPLLFKLRWAISQARKIREHAIKNYKKLMERAEELVTSVCRRIIHFVSPQAIRNELSHPEAIRN